MASLYEILDDAHEGEGMTALGRQFGLTPVQTETAVTALLPAISTGLKQSTATVDGKKLGVMGGAGAAVFGDHFEVGQDVDKGHVANIQGVFECFMSAQRR